MQTVEQLRQAVAAGGGQWLGVQPMYDIKPDQVMFDIPGTHITCYLPVTAVTPSAVSIKMQNKLKEFTCN